MTAPTNGRWIEAKKIELQRQIEACRLVLDFQSPTGFVLEVTQKDLVRFTKQLKKLNSIVPTT